MKFENTQVWGFEHALRGMRNAKNSWDKADSNYECCKRKNKICDKDCCNPICPGPESKYIIGPNDMKLAQALIKAGSEHRKFMRQIFVSVDITAPIYWWKEFDTYKVGTVANSTSTMHTIQKQPITLESFEIDDYCGQSLLLGSDIEWSLDCDVKDFIVILESLRQKYLETKDKRYWKELIRWLPEGWLQTRTITFNYENILGMCSKGQRRFHKLNEWSGIDDSTLTNFTTWVRTLPYAQEFIFIDELEN